MPRARRDDVYRRPGSNGGFRTGYYYKDFSGSGNLKLLPGSEALSHDSEGERKARLLLDELRRVEALRLSSGSVRAPSEVGRVAADAPAGDKVSIKELFEIASRRVRISNTKKTADGYIQKWRRIQEWCSYQEPPIEWPSQLTRSGVERFKEELQASVIQRYGGRGWDGVHAINRHLTAWRHAWGYLMNPEDPDLYTYEPGSINLDGLFSLVDAPTRESRPIGLTIEQLDAIVQAETDPYFKLLWTFARGCGFREDEVRHIAEDDFSNPKKDLYLIRVTGKPLGFCRCHTPPKHNKGFEPKRHQKRSVSVSKQTYDAGLKILKLYKDQIRDPNGKTTWTRLQIACAAAGVPRISMQHFRYNFASHLFNTGKVKLEQVSRMLGHKDVRTTEIYLRVVDNTVLPASSMPF